MGRRIVNDVGGYGWRVVTRGKLVSCTLFAICKLWLVYTIRGEARRGEENGKNCGLSTSREREREGRVGGSALALVGVVIVVIESIASGCEEKVENTRFRFIESVFTRGKIDPQQQVPSAPSG